MKELKKYMGLSDEKFGQLVKIYFDYMETEDIRNNIDEEVEILFKTELMKKCQYQINDTNRKRKKRGV